MFLAEPAPQNIDDAQSVVGVHCCVSDLLFLHHQLNDEVTFRTLTLRQIDADDSNVLNVEKPPGNFLPVFLERFDKPDEIHAVRRIWNVPALLLAAIDKCKYPPV